MAAPWYEDGLRFECTQCGKCCSGSPGFVWVATEEVIAMARALDMEEEQFRDRFVRREGDRYSLVEYPDGDCILLDPTSRQCLVYAARPVQCRTWPFWTSNVESPQAWRETRRECPGAGQGKLYSLADIESARKQKSEER